MEKWRKPIYKKNGKKKLFMNREMYKVYKGKIPEKGMVFRSCFNDYCLKPDHLILVMPGETQPQRPGVQVGEFFQQKQHMQSIKAEQ